jgi:hypothetical protein
MIYTEAAHNERQSMKPFHLMAALAIMLCAATAGIPASTDGGGENVDDTSTRQRSADLDGGHKAGGRSDLSGRSWEEVLKDISGPVTQAELDKAVAETKRKSSVPDHFPNAPKSSTLNPPERNPGNKPAQNSE